MLGAEMLRSMNNNKQHWHLLQFLLFSQRSHTPIKGKYHHIILQKEKLRLRKTGQLI